MAKYTSLVPGVEIDNAAEDFRAALKVEQYRVGKAAVYLPAGFRWEYVPPAVALITDAGSFTLNLDKADSVQKILDAIGK